MLFVRLFIGPRGMENVYKIKDKKEKRWYAGDGYLAYEKIPVDTFLKTGASESHQMYDYDISGILWVYW